MPHANKYVISLFLTNRCNLNCIYCYTNKEVHSNQKLDLEFAKYGIKEFFDKHKSYYIRYFGSGEPTLEFELMKSIQQYSESISPNGKVKSELQTNGVFSNEVADWIAENIDIIWISCDGSPRFQDYYRPSLGGLKTSLAIEKNIKRMQSKNKGMIGARVTIGEKNLKHQEEIVQYFHNLGIKNIWTDPIFSTIGEKELDKGINLLEYAKEYLKAKQLADKLGVFYGSIYTCNFDGESEYHCRACVPIPHLTTDGFVSACDMAMFGKNIGKMDIFIYGKWNTETKQIDYNDEKIKILQSRNVNNMPGCKGCEVSKNCGGYCLGETMNETGSIFGKNKKICSAIKFLSKRMDKNFGEYEFNHP